MTELQSTVLGPLAQDARFDDWFVAEAPLGMPFFDGLPLEVTFIGVVKGEEARFVAEADAALRAFRQLTTTDRRAATPLLWANYVEMANSVEQLEVDEDEPDGIWRFVHPTDISLRRHEGPDADMYVLVECHCDWELEHGLQLVFRQGRMLTRVSYNDGELVDDHDDALMKAYYARFGGASE